MGTPVIFDLFNYEDMVAYENPSLKLPYTVRETDDETVADALIASVIVPSIVTAAGELFFNSYTKKNIGGEAWLVELTYGKDPPRKAGKRTLQMDSGGSTVHLTQSLSTVNSWGINAAGTSVAAENFKGAIGVNQDKVDGVDVPGEDCKFTISVTYGVEQLDELYFSGLPALRGNVNNDNLFFRYKGQTLYPKIGSLRFEDFHVSDPGMDLWEVAYTFHYQPGVASGIVIGDLPAAGSVPATIGKDGWDYLWVLYANATGTRRWLKKPVAVYVERIAARIPFITSFIGVFEAS